MVPKKDNVSKIYCEKCNSIFKSRKQFEAHFDKHSGEISCEACPIDIAIQKIVTLFRRTRS